MGEGLRGNNPAAPPFSKGPYTWDQHVTFTQGVSGLNTPGDIWYVDKNQAGGVSGDGKSWKKAFLTITEGFAALDDYDTLFIAPGNYDEVAKLELSSLKGVKIYGFGNGMQWNEGSTCIRDVSHTVAADLLDITGCMALEIAGISFISTDSYDAINFTGLNYSTHIHDCCFVGDVGGGTVQVYGVNIAGSNGPDTYIHDCKFFIQATAGILNLGQRNVIENNVFIVPTDGAGISGIDNVKGFNIIKDNYFLGAATNAYGIYSAAATAGNFLIANNLFAGFESAAGGYEISVPNTGDTNCLNNYMDGTAGAITVVDPSHGG